MLDTIMLFTDIRKQWWCINVDIGDFSSTHAFFTQLILLKNATVNLEPTIAFQKWCHIYRVGEGGAVEPVGQVDPRSFSEY